MEIILIIWVGLFLAIFTELQFRAVTVRDYAIAVLIAGASSTCVVFLVLASIVFVMILLTT